MDGIIDQWNKAAEKYSEEQERSDYSAVNKVIVEKRFGMLNGEKILDLGCGNGCYTDHFRKIGGDPVGVDGSETMIDIARKRYPECSFQVADVLKPLPFEDAGFDIILCNQLLMDIPDIDGVIKECGRVIKRGGTFYFSIVHPAFYNGSWEEDKSTGKIGKMITSYLTPSRSVNDFWGETTHFHRPLSYYLNTVSNAGFMLVYTEEPKTYNDDTKNEDLPLFFIAEWKKL